MNKLKKGCKYKFKTLSRNSDEHKIVKDFYDITSSTQQTRANLNATT